MAEKKRQAGEFAVTQGPSRSALIIYSVLAVVALLGLADATYLTIAHLTGDDAVCGSLAGCSIVLGSSYASVKGIPTASFGGVAYFTVFSLSVLAAFGYPWVKRPLTLIIGLMLLTSLYLLYLQAFVLHAFCPFCLFSAALTFFLAGLLLAVPATR
jgi:uncharacterized membrane protein